MKTNKQELDIMINENYNQEMENEPEQSTLEIATKAFKIVTKFGEKIISPGYTHYEYITNGLDISASQDDYKNKRNVYIRFNHRFVFDDDLSINNDKELSTANKKYSPGIWEKMINILYIDVLELEAKEKLLLETKHEQIEIIEGIEKLFSYYNNISKRFNKITIENKNGKKVIIYAEDDGYAVNYRCKQVFKCSFNGECLVFISGDWQRFIKGSIENIEKKEDLNSYNDFVRSRRFQKK